MTYLRTLLFLSLVALSCTAQAGREPSWMNVMPKPDNSTYIYVRESGEGSNRNEALNQALARVFQSTANRIGQPFDSREINNALQAGSGYEYISRQYNIPINKVDEYFVELKDGTVRVYVLCQVATAGNRVPQWTAFNESAAGESRNGTALLKSVFIPGLGQMGKGRTASGVATLAGEVLLVGGGLGCYYAAQSQLGVMRDYSTAYDDFVRARDNYNTLQSVSYIAWGAAGVLYVYNLIRAYTIQPRRSDAVAFAPSLIAVPSAVAPAVGLTFNL